MAKETLLRFGKPLLIVAAMLPLAALIYAALNNSLGADPVKALIVETGEWALWVLLACFAVSPLRSWFGVGWLLRFRRTLGLLAFFYVSLHLVVVSNYLFFWDWAVVREELSERPYIIAGFSAWLLMLPMALTSNNWSVRRLRRNWRRVHSLMYPIMLLAWLHIAWQLRSSYFDAIVYGLIIFSLFLQRVKKLPKSG